MKIDAIAALLRHKNGNPPQEALEAAAFEALDMVVSVVESLRRIADGVERLAKVTTGGETESDVGFAALCGAHENDMLATVRRALEKRYGQTIKGFDGTPESVAYDALGRMMYP